MSSELCRVRTVDGLLLDGLLSLPDEPVCRVLPVDAFLLVHGTASNFYAAGVLETFADRAVSAGAAVLRINTRGHDGMASIPGERGAVAGGAAFERISDCPVDLAAWLDCLAERGFSRIALAGHSMGAVKAIYSQACAPHAAVHCVIAISPPRFCHARLLENDEFRTDYGRAVQLVAAGRGGELVSVRQPMPLTLTADGVAAKYGPHDDYDVLRHLPQVACPALVVLGTGSADSSPAFRGLAEELIRLAARQSTLAVELVDGANTVYTGCREAPYERAAGWLSALARD